MQPNESDDHAVQWNTADWLMNLPLSFFVDADGTVLSWAGSVDASGQASTHALSSKTIVLDEMFQCDDNVKLSQLVSQSIDDRSRRTFVCRSRASDNLDIRVNGSVAPCTAQTAMVLFSRSNTDEGDCDVDINQVESLRRINERLVSSEARKRAVLEGIADGVAVASRDGCLETFNPAAQQILGIGLIESDKTEWTSVYGLCLPDGVTPCPTEELPLVRALQGHHAQDTHLVVESIDGEDPVHLHVTASPFFDDQGAIDGGVAIFKDVTERIRSERLLSQAREELELRLKELKASEQKYQDLYEEAPDMYLTVEATSGVIVGCNQTLANVTGFQKFEIVGKSIFLLHDETCIDEVAAAFDSFRISGEFVCGAASIRCKNGRRIELSVNVREVRDSDGMVILGRFVWRDITKRRNAEDQLARSRDELSHMTRLHTASEMATGLAHELNQPLNAIGNYARGFVRRADVGSKVTNELHAAANEIVAESERAASIIAGLRRLVAKQLPARSVTDLNEVVEHAVLLCHGQTQRHGVSQTLDLSADLPESTVDSVQIKQVVISLMLNAIDALSNSSVPNPQIVVSTRLRSEGLVEIGVEDNGDGIAEAEFERVFKPFHTTKKDGMGMGLAICRSIVENHGGRIWAQPGQCGGASFCFTLPIELSER